MRTQQENLERRRVEAEIEFEEPRRRGPGYRSLEEKSVDPLWTREERRAGMTRRA